MTIEIEDDVDISDELRTMDSLLEKRKEPRTIDDVSGDRDELSTEPEPDEEAKDRNDRRRDRGKVIEALEESRNQAAQMDERFGRLEQQNNALRSQLEQRSRPQQQQAGPRQKLDGLYRQMEDLNGRFEAHVMANGGKADPDTQKEFTERYRHMEEERYLIMNAATQQPQAQAPAQTAQQVVQEQNRMRNGDVYDGGRNQRWANAQYGLLAAEYSDANGNLTVDPQDLHNHVMGLTRKKFGIQRRGLDGGPTKSQRSRHSGRSSGPANGEAGPKTIRMTPAYRAMADAAYPEIDDSAKRHKKWAVEVGSRLVNE